MVGAWSVSASIVGDAIGTIVAKVFSLVTGWVGDGAAAVVGSVGQALNATSRPILQAGFGTEYAMMMQIGALLSVPLLVFALIQSIIRQDIGHLAKVVLVRLPASFVLSGVAVEVVRLVVAGTDELSKVVLQSAGSSTTAVLKSIVTTLVGLGGASAAVPLAGFASLLFALLVALFALVLWLELVLRSAAVAVATLFLPLALAGFAWPVTAHWAKRLAETLFALVLSKLVIVSVLALAATALGSVGTTGVSGGVEGVALLLLAAIAPFSLLRLIPMFEAGAAGHLEGLSRRPLHLADPASQPRRVGASLLDMVQGAGPAFEVAGLAGAAGVAGVAGGSGAAGGSGRSGSAALGGSGSGSPGSLDPSASSGAARGGTSRVMGDGLFEGMAPPSSDSPHGPTANQGIGGRSGNDPSEPR